MEAGTMMLIGTGIQAGSRIAGGMSARQAGAYNADALDRQGTEEVAAAQRVAAERRLETDRVLSRQVALGAASGAGAGPSLLDIVGDTAQAGEYRAQADQYQGNQRARALHERGRVARWEGDRAFMGSILEGIGGIASGAASYGLRFAPATTPPGDPTRTSSWLSTGPRYG
jgi:hypothetical protein